MNSNISTKVLRAGLSSRPAVVEGLLQGVQDKVRMGGARRPPSDNLSGEGVEGMSRPLLKL